MPYVLAVYLNRCYFSLELFDWYAMRKNQSSPSRLEFVTFRELRSLDGLSTFTRNNKYGGTLVASR